MSMGHGSEQIDVGVDRTKEFFDAMAIFRRQLGTKAPPSRPSRGVGPVATEARRIASRLRTCRGVVEQVSQLAERDDLFADPGERVSSLSGRCQRVLREDTAALDNMENNWLATMPENAVRRHWKAACDSLRRDLLETAAGLQEALRKRATRLRSQRSRRVRAGQSSWAPSVAGMEQSPLFSDLPKPSSSPSSHTSNLRSRTSTPPKKSLIRHRQAVGGAHAVDFDVEGGGDAEWRDDVSGASAAAKMEARASNYHRARARLNEAEAVESKFTEIGAMFSRVATLVQEQGEAWETVAQNIDTAADHASAAEAQLSKYLETISADRRIILTVLAVILGVIVIVVLVRS